MHLFTRNHQPTLDFVNTIREGYGYEPLKKLPKGKRRTPTNCVVARALADVKGGAAVGGFSGLTVYGETLSEPMEQFEIPYPVARFVLDFDTLKYPRLIKFG